MLSVEHGWKQTQNHQRQFENRSKQEQPQGTSTGNSEGLPNIQTKLIWEFQSVNRIPAFSPSLSSAYLCKTLCYKKSLLVLDDHWVPGTCLLSLEIPQRKDSFSHPFFERSLKEESQRLRCPHMTQSPAVTHPWGQRGGRMSLSGSSPRKACWFCKMKGERTWIMKTVSASVKSTVPTPALCHMTT